MNKNTIIVSIYDVRSDKYSPPRELQNILRSTGVLAEIITPFNNLSNERTWKSAIWEGLMKLSEKRGFSFLVPIIFLLKGFEIYRQVKLSWKEYDRILAYDRISAFAAQKASDSKLEITLLNHYGSDPYMSYLYNYGIERRRLGYIMMQKMLIAIFHQPIHRILSLS